MSLVFEVAAPPVADDPQRADVAVFIGHVARRAGRALPASVRAQLREGGWVDGVWRRPESQLQSLENLPVVVDSWDLFDHLFAWDQRPLGRWRSDAEPATPQGDDPENQRRCASYLGAAVRSFFARGGQRAVVLRVGDPWPYLESATRRAARRRERIRRMLPAFADIGAPERPFQPHDPASWQGIHHLYGLRGASVVLLPDLADACTFEPPVPATLLQLPQPPEVFVECSPGEPPGPADAALRAVPAPRLDERGLAAWRQALGAARQFLADPRLGGERLLLASLPLTDSGAVPVDRGRASAFVQLAWPWLRTTASADLPEGLEPPEGVLAGLVAAGALARGTFRSVAGDFSMPRLRDLTGAEPVPSWASAESHPTVQLARRVCVFAPLPDGWALQSDVTTSGDEAWRFGGASRLMSAVIRAARAAGDAVVFDANGPALWGALRQRIEDVLMGFWHEGAFNGNSPAEAFDVRCDRSTMSQNDLDAGRLQVQIGLWPAAAIERITVVLALGDGGRDAVLREAA